MTSSRDDESRLYDFIPSHPAVVMGGGQLAMHILRVLAVFAMIVCISVILTGCAVKEHADGMGYTVRYANSYEAEPIPQRKKVIRKKIVHRKAENTVVVVHTTDKRPHVLNVGQDNEIPSEYANFVSSRSIKTWRQRHRMCSEARSGYCNYPNVAHCHGSYCHAHPGGKAKHTH